MKQIGTYSTYKLTDGSTAYKVKIPKARKEKGHLVTYAPHYLTDDVEDIQNDLRKELNIMGKVTFVPSNRSKGKIIVTDR